ncbi:metallophosphoesterase family protein [Thalassoglobus neptunius]|uniref:metallophosphoesterase family protein n=1 Tax=Thalassoglobus neptunius TaxID=1938619 RepID=UPI0018D25586|nr:metallophosphoesterase [Thalassoglobus neptunius]
MRKAELPFLRAHAVDCEIGPLVITADLQGRIRGQLLGVALAEELEVLVELGEIDPPAGIALAGDLYDHPELQKLGASGDVAEVYEAMKRIAPVVGVLGNHDQLDQVLNDVSILDGDVTGWADLKVAGVGGIIGNPSRLNRRREEEFQVMVRRALTQRPDLLLLHQGPPGNDCDQRGSLEILEAISSSRDLLIVCGHCHWNDPLSENGRTQILNVDARVVIIN